MAKATTIKPAKARSNFLEQVKKNSKNEYVSFGSDDDRPPASWIDTGSYIFNALLSGSIYKGLPGNKITMLAGEEATGKTYFLAGLLKHYLESNPKAQAILYETEDAWEEVISERKLDGDRVLLNQVTTAQQFRTEVAQTLDLYKETDEADRVPLFFGLDSLGMLSTTKEMEDTAKGLETRDMTRAQVLKAAFRVLTLKMGRLDIPMVITNHVYDTVGQQFVTKEAGGGKGAKYAASQIVYLSKKKEKDKTTNEVTGDIIHCWIEKSRITKPFREVDVLLTYDKGLHRYYGLEELAAKYGIIKKLDTQFEFDGKKVFRKHLINDPEKYYTKEILDRIDEAARKEFKYGQGADVEKTTEQK